MRRFIEWLSFHPTHDDIARALATDYLSKHGISAVRFGRVNSDDSLTVLGEYGHAGDKSFRGQTIPSTVWRTGKSDVSLIIRGESKSNWSNDSKTCVISLRDHGVLQGYLMVDFNNAVSDAGKNDMQDDIEDFSIPIALYISLITDSRKPSPTVVSIPDTRDAGADHLTPRQLLILRGMVEGKTNHEMATEMGFSVSTIRHETMRIYQALAVSDRKEAAKKALMLSIL